MKPSASMIVDIDRGSFGRRFDHMLGSLKAVDSRIDGITDQMSNPDNTGAPVKPPAQGEDFLREECEALSWGLGGGVRQQGYIEGAGSLGD